MVETREEFKLGEFLKKLDSISQKMQTGEGESFYDLKEFLQPYRGAGLFEHSDQMQKPVFTTLWLITTFVFDELEDNFGGDTPGFPVKEGEPILRAIIEDLGHFIQGSVFGPGSSISRFADALMNYAKLVRMTNNKEISSFELKDWRKLS